MEEDYFLRKDFFCENCKRNCECIFAFGNVECLKMQYYKELIKYYIDKEK